MNLKDCYNFQDFRKLAKKKLPSPIFNYIDGAADDETTFKRNTKAFEDVDLIPNVLRGVKEVDMSTTIFGKKLEMLKSTDDEFISTNQTMTKNIFGGKTEMTEDELI